MTHEEILREQLRLMYVALRRLKINIKKTEEILSDLLSKKDTT